MALAGASLYGVTACSGSDNDATPIDARPDTDAGTLDVVESQPVRIANFNVHNLFNDKVVSVDYDRDQGFLEGMGIDVADGKLDESLKSYMKALIEHVGDKKAHAGAAQVYELQDNKAKAIDEWSTYIRMDCCSEFANTVAKPSIAKLQDTKAEPAPPADKAAG